MINAILIEEAQKRGIVHIKIHKRHEPRPYEDIKFIDEVNRKLQLNSKKMRDECDS